MTESTEQEIAAAWNAQADEFNQWDELDLQEKIEWAAKFGKNQADHPVHAVPKGWRLVPEELLERATESLGSFVSDHGWGQADMDTFDDLSVLTVAPQPPEAACNPSMRPELATKAAPVQMPEPVEYQARVRPTWDGKQPWTEWGKCSPEAAADYERVPLLHDWVYEVRKLYTEHQVRQLLADHGITN